MAITLTYDPTLSRVRITADGLPDGVMVQVQRSTDQVRWSTVRGGQDVTVVGGALPRPVDDYEFAPDVVNWYRLVGPPVGATFNTAATASWPPAETGQVWTLSGGASAFAAAGGVGTQSQTAVNTLDYGLLDAGSTDLDATADVSLPMAAASGATITQWLAGRAVDNTSFYAARLDLGTDGHVVVGIYKRVGGTLSGSLGPGSVTVATTHAAGDWWRVRLQLQGSTIRAKAWPRAGAEPDAWAVTATDTDVTTGTGVALMSRLESGNTSTLPVVVSWDNLIVAGSASIASASITPSLGGLVWLKNIAKPYLNRPVTIQDFGDVTRASRSSTLAVIGRPDPVAITDVRAARQWSLTVPIPIDADGGGTFGPADVEADAAPPVLTDAAFDALMATGDVLLIQVPAGSRAPSGYVLVGDVTRTRQFVHGRYVTWSLPCVEVAAPGPDIVGSTATCQTVLDLYATCADLLAQVATCGDLLELVADPVEVLAS